jgi:Tfp pilus assembly protein PilF
MEDTVVRNVWLTSTAAVLMVVVSVGTTARGNPGTTWWGGPTASTVPASSTVPQMAALAQPVPPSSQISPSEHPVKYFAAAMSELPIASAFRSGATPTGMAAGRATAAPDSISLQTPAGPPSPQLFISLAQMSERQGNVDQARNQYKQALSMWPGNVDVLRAAARMEDRHGHLDWAEYLYQRAAASNPHHAGALNDLGLCLARQGKLEQSVQTIEQAIHLQPDRALYRNNAATVLVELRQDQKALAHLAAVHSPADASYNMGQLLVERGRSDEAEPYFVAALQQDPQLQPAQVALAKLRGETIAGQSPAISESQVPTAPTAEEGPQFAPQPGYQPTAQTPAAPTPAYPTYLPPTYQQAPTGSYAVPIGSPVSVAPRHLPPVGALPGVMNR